MSTIGRLNQKKITITKYIQKEYWLYKHIKICIIYYIHVPIYYNLLLFTVPTVIH